MITNKQKEALHSAFYFLTEKEGGNQFLGTLLQELTVRFDGRVPTAAISYNKTFKRIEVMLNADFFMAFDTKERASILLHEVLHFLYDHLNRLPFLASNTSDEDKKMFNVAGDMAINQYLRYLPKTFTIGDKEYNTIDVAAWKLKDGTPFPKWKTMEEYYDLIKDNQEANKDKLRGQGSDGGEGEQQSFDVHDWDELSEEDKKDLLNETANILKRTVEKTNTDYSNLPGFIKDLIERINVNLNRLNYKQILQKTIKKHASCADRESTWTKPNKRYGVYAPGTKLAKIPKLDMYIDTSGSISHVELNAFLMVIDNFLKVGTRRCKIHLWHTEVYKSLDYKLGQRFDGTELESGGTCVEDTLSHIKKTSPNLSIVLTDGYFYQSSIKPKSELIWVISEGGNKDHPLVKLGKTIPLEHL